MKRLFVLVALIAASGAAKADNIISTDQVGPTANLATQSVRSSFGGNTAYTQQTGNGNDSTILQTGGGNSASVIQNGAGNLADVTQSGGENFSVTQNGGAAITVTQTGMPGHVSITQSGPRR